MSSITTRESRVVIYPKVRRFESNAQAPPCQVRGIRVVQVPSHLQEPVAAFFAATGLTVHVKVDPALRGFSLITAAAAVLPTVAIPPLGYALEIGTSGISLLAGYLPGFYAALQSLWQLLEASAEVPCGCIVDWPEVKVRSFQIDLGRQPETLPELKRLLRQQARCHYNECQLYLENSIKLDALHAFADPDGLTKTEFQELAAYGRDLGIEVVPSLNLLGHMEKVLHHPSSRQLSETRNGPRHPDQPFIFDVCPELPATRAFVAEIIREVCEISASPKFMTGLDECWTLGSCPLCRARLDATGGAGAIFGDYLRFLHGEITRHGKSMWMWEDMLFYHKGALDHLPRDIGMNIWHYQHIEEYPTYSFQNWGRRDSVQELAGRGHPFMLCCGGDATHLQSMQRFATGYPLDGLLVVQWEGRQRVQEFYAPGRATAAGVLWHGGIEEPRQVAAAMMGGDASRAASFGELLLLNEARPAGGIQTGANEPPRYWSWPASATARAYQEQLLAAFDERKPLPETFDVQQAFLAAGYVGLCADCVREETALVGRRMLQQGLFLSAVLDREIEKLRHAVVLAETLTGCGRRLHEQYAAGQSERPMVETFAKLPDEPRRLLERLERFQVAPSTATWPYPAVSLSLDAFIIDPCAHRIRLAVSTDGKTFTEIYAGGFPVSFDKFSCKAFTLTSVPRFVHLKVGGFATLGFRHLRLETLAGTQLPKAVVETGGLVSHPEYLLEFDAKVALFNEPDVMKNWLSLTPLPKNYVVLEF